MLEQPSFGHWLKRKRKALDLTRERLAQRVGCSVATIRKLEAEERRPSIQIANRLAEVFDVLPNEQTAFLKFTRGEWESAPQVAIEDTPWRVPVKPPRSNLPAALTSLIGRGREIAEVRSYLGRPDIRLVTLLGPPGIGKTRLSLEAAHRSFTEFLGGVFFVALAPLDDPALIAFTIAQALGYVEIRNQSVAQQLMDGIGDQQMLLILDNCEHLIEEVVPLASNLLLACPLLKILATSREAFRVRGEWLYTVPALDVPEVSSAINLESAANFQALTLFVERARAVRSDFSLTADNIQAVARICAHLDGLPLAIELIAARIRVMTPETLLARLDDQFILSADGTRAVSARQKTLKDAIGWSYNLLSTEEQEIFVFLSAFSGGFTLKAAETILSHRVSEKSMSDHITSLLDKSLLQYIPHDHGESRFTMLVTIQDFALKHLRHTGAETEVRDGHLVYFLELAELADREIHGPDQVEWLDRLDPEHANFRTALEWCVSNKKTEAALRLLGSLCWPWFVRDHFSEVQSWFDKVRVLPGIASYPAAYAKLLNHMGHQDWVLGRYSNARSVLEESRRICLKLGVDGEQYLADTLAVLGMVARSNEGDHRTAQSLFEQSLEVSRKLEDPRNMAFASFNLGYIAGKHDDTSAMSWLEQSLDLYNQVGDLWGLARPSQRLGELLLAKGNFEQARIYFEQHLKLDENLHFRQGIVAALFNLGELYRHQNEFEQAEQFYEKGQALCYEYGLNSWGGASFGLGLIALQQDDYPRAKQHFINYFDSTWSMSKKLSACDFLTGMAAVAAGMNQPKRAAKLFGATQVLFENTDYRFSAFDRAEFDRHLQIARKQIEEIKFGTLAAEGRALTMEQTISVALEQAE